MNWAEKSLLLTVAIVATAVLALVLIGKDLGGRVPPLPQFRTAAGTNDKVWRGASFQDLLSETTFAKLRPATGTNNPFYTTYFLPPPKPPPTKPPPPTLTRKVALAYLGFVELNGGEKRAYLRVGTNLLVAAVGAKVVADLVIQNIAFDALTLRGGTQETVIPFRQQREVEVPVK